MHIICVVVTRVFLRVNSVSKPHTDYSETSMKIINEVNLKSGRTIYQLTTTSHLNTGWLHTSDSIFLTERSFSFSTEATMTSPNSESEREKKKRNVCWFSNVDNNLRFFFQTRHHISASAKIILFLLKNWTAESFIWQLKYPILFNITTRSTSTLA